MTALIDTNLLVYRFDPRNERKQRVATELLRERDADGPARLPHQAIVELMAAVTRPLGRPAPLLSAADEDFQHDRVYGSVHVVNPFV